MFFPAFAPAASPRRAGLRLAREVALVLAVALALVEWPLRRPHAGAEDFVVRVADEPLDERVALPLGRKPFFEPVPLCAPFRLVLEAVFEPHRAPVAAIREPVAGRRAPEVWDSEVARRTGRLPLGFAAANAGLRLREWVVGRLKWGLAAADFELEAGLRAAGGLEACGSAAGRGLIGAGGAGEAGIRASYSNAFISWSRERRKLVEAVIDELEYTVGGSANSGSVPAT